MCRCNFPVASKGAFSMQSAQQKNKSAPAPVTDGGLAVAPDTPAWLLPGIIGAQLSSAVSTMQDVMQEFTRTRHMSRVHMQALTRAMDAAQKVAMQSQQISRLAGGRLRQSHERLELGQMVHAALDDRTRFFQSSGIEVYRQIRPVEVIVDPGLLHGLIEAAVDWAAEQGHRIVVSLDIKNWPEHAVLVLKANDTVASRSTQELRPDQDSLCWHLMIQIAQTMGVMVDRAPAPDGAIVMIEFPRTVKQLEGLTAIEVDGGGDSSMHSESKPLAGHRVLLVTADDRLRQDIKTICLSMGLIMDSTPTTLQAIRFCELDQPHLIVIDEALRDYRFEELRQDLVRTDVNFPFIEIASESNTFELASWMSDSITRVSRDVLKAQLPSVLVLELAKGI